MSYKISKNQYMLANVKLALVFILAIRRSYQQSAIPMYEKTILSPYCYSGYILINGLCYPQIQQSCQITCNSLTCVCLTMSTLPPPTTTLSPQPSPDCPNNLVRIGGICRIIYCPRGELHEGRCIEPKCSNGTVWISGKCTTPGIIRTIIEVENRFNTQANYTESVIEKPTITNNVQYYTEAPEVETSPKRCTPKSRTTTETPTTGRCCRLVSPRMCKVKFGKWLCSHRHHMRCDNFCGNHSLIYLTISEVIDIEGVVSMPPNPNLRRCNSSNCPSDAFNDCSGCVSGRKETCSTYCYRFHCPQTYCKSIDQADYCKDYPQNAACMRSGGCYHESCYNDCD